MGYADIIAREAQTLPPQRQVEILDFIAFLKTRSGSPERAQGLETADEIEAFFRSFHVEAFDAWSQTASASALPAAAHLTDEEVTEMVKAAR
jgi:hypothetical protein